MANPAKDAKLKIQAEHPGATVFRRGRKFIELEHPTEPNRFMHMCHIGPMHYGTLEDQEIDTAWVVSSGAWDYESVKNDFHSFVRDSVPVSYRYYDVITEHYVELTVNNVLWVNDNDDRENAASFSQVTPTIDDNKITWEGIATGWNITIHAQTARLAKWLEIDSLTNLGSPTIGGTNISLAFELRFQKSTGLEIYVDGVLWDENSNNPQLTNANVEFRDGDTGEPVFTFIRPVAYDLDTNQEVNQYLRKVGNNLFAEVRIPWSWLESAVYPVTIDPTIGPQDVTTSLDDSIELGDGGSNMPTATQYNNDEIGNKVAARWSLAIASGGVTVNSSYTNWYNDHPTQDDVGVDMDCEDVDSVAQYTANAGDIGNRSYTGSIVNWTEADLVQGYEQSPDLSTPIEAVLDRGGWSTGNYLAVMHEGDSGGLGARFSFYDFATDRAPQIYIDYTAAGGESFIALGNQRKRKFQHMITR